MSMENFTTCSPTQSQPNPIVLQLIQRDLNQIKIHIKKTSIIFVDPIDSNVLHLEAAILGPESTPYENAVFLVHIEFSDQYPFVPPKSIIFKRATMHPNIDEYGVFKSKLLKPESWSPAMTIKDILEHVWACLAFPDIDSNECDPTRANFYKTNKEQFEIIAREYAVKYAMAT